MCTDHILTVTTNKSKPGPFLNIHAMLKNTNMSDSSSFTIKLSPTGDEDAKLRVSIQNELNEYERKHLTDSGSKLKVQGDMVHVVHGRLTPGGDRATLIGVVFRFQSVSQRIRKVEILLTFSSDSKPGSDLDPEVMKIAYQDVYFWNPTVVDRKVTYAAKLLAEAGGGGIGQAGAELGWEQTESFKIKDRALLFGSIRFEGRDHGAKNAAEWTLKENKEAKDGVPGLFATAILLKRKTDGRFTMTVEVDVEAGIMSKIKSQFERLSGRKDAPVVFDPDPNRKPTPSDLDQHRENLSVLDLKKLSEVRGAEQISITPTSEVTQKSEVTQESEITQESEVTQETEATQETEGMGD